MGIRLGSFVSQKTFILYTQVTMWASMRICNSVLCWIIRKNNEFLLQPVGIIYVKSILLLIWTWSFRLSRLFILKILLIAFHPYQILNITCCLFMNVTIRYICSNFVDFWQCISDEAYWPLTVVCIQLRDQKQLLPSGGFITTAETT